MTTRPSCFAAYAVTRCGAARCSSCRARSPHARFTANLHALTAAEGGRHTPFASDYEPQFYFRTTDVPGSLDLGPDELVHPGDSIEVTVALGKAVAMEPGLGFAVREGTAPSPPER